eukprot:SAG22_NODE_16_length_32723_cov_26.404825_40_plen_84_part_00
MTFPKSYGFLWWCHKGRPARCRRRLRCSTESLRSGLQERPREQALDRNADCVTWCSTITKTMTMYYQQHFTLHRPQNTLIHII